jgi:AbrB family looped-hinge helix DNA binding protein
MKFESKVGERGQVVIPKAIRDNLGISKHTAIVFEMEGAKVSLSPKRDMRNFELAMSRYGGSLRKQMLAEGYASTDELMKDIRGR